MVETFTGSIVCHLLIWVTSGDHNWLVHAMAHPFASLTSYCAVDRGTTCRTALGGKKCLCGTVSILHALHTLGQSWWKLFTGSWELECAHLLEGGAKIEICHFQILVFRWKKKKKPYWTHFSLKRKKWRCKTTQLITSSYMPRSLLRCVLCSCETHTRVWLHLNRKQVVSVSAKILWWTCRQASKNCGPETGVMSTESAIL